MGAIKKIIMLTNPFIWPLLVGFSIGKFLNNFSSAIDELDKKIM